LWHRQVARGRDDERAANIRRSLSKGVGVGDLAAEIKSAQKGKDFRDSGAAIAQPYRQIELRFFAHDHAGAFSSGIRGREQKDALV